MTKKLSRREIQAQIDALNKDLEAAADDDEDYELHISSGDKSVRLPASRAKGWLKEHFGIGDDDDEGEGGDEGEGTDGGEGDPPPKSTIWGRK